MIEFMLTSSALILAVLGLRALLRNKLSALAQYALWLLVLARLLLPVNIAKSPLSILNIFVVTGTPAQNTLAETQALPLLPFAPAPADTAPGAAPALPTAGNLAAPASTPAGNAGHTRLPLTTVLALVWGGGAVLLGAWFLFVNLRFSRRLRAQAAAYPHAAGKLPVYTVQGLHTSCLLGLFRPAIYLAEAVPGEETLLQHSLAHETCHYRQGDHIWAWVRILCVTVYWFHPLVWVAAVLSKQDCELACDEAAIRQLGEAQRLAYGNTLLQLAAGQPARGLRLGAAATTLGTGARALHRRIVRVARARRMSYPTAIFMTAICLLLVGCTMTGQASPGGNPPVTHEQPGNTPGAADGALASSATAYPYLSAHDMLQNRFENLEKAAALLDGIILQPGELFSFNAHIGPRTEAAGWKRADDTLEGMATPVAGGLNQVCSTLYAAALHAQLPILERTQAPAPAAYTEPGQEALADDNGADLQFQNNTGAPIRIAVQLGEPATDSPLGHIYPAYYLRVTLYGGATDGAERRIRSEIISETPPPEELITIDDPTLPTGMWDYARFPQTGQEVQVYRDTYRNGTLEGAELLYTDTYPSVQGIQRRGTKTPYLLTDMTPEELKTLAELLHSEYRYSSWDSNFHVATAHYTGLFRLLEIDCGGAMGGPGISFTLGVPMAEFSQEMCYPYAAVLFALDSGVMQMDIGSMAYDQSGKDRVLLLREDVESYYQGILDKPLVEYAKSSALLLALLENVTAFHK